MGFGSSSMPSISLPAPPPAPAPLALNDSAELAQLARSRAELERLRAGNSSFRVDPNRNPGLAAAPGGGIQLPQ